MLLYGWTGGDIKDGPEEKTSVVWSKMKGILKEGRLEYGWKDREPEEGQRT